MKVQRKLKMQWGNEIQEEPIEWLWRPWLPRGVVVVVDGDPGVGKSSMMFDLVARISTGRPFPLIEMKSLEQPAGACTAAVNGNGQGAGAPDPIAALREYASHYRTPGRILYVAMEDPVESIVVPRMKAAGADMANVAILGDVEESGPNGNEELQLQLPRDLELIAQRCRELRPELFVVDPIFAVLGYDENNHFIKANDDQNVRRLTFRLKKLAEECGVTIVLIRHLNKSPGGSAIQRGSGSIAIAGQARSVMLVGKDPAAPDSRVLSMVKTNLDAVPRSVNFRVIYGGNASTIEWQGYSDLSADDLVHYREAEVRLQPAVEAAIYFLKMTLYELNELPWAELVELAAKEEISAMSLRRAREKINLGKSFVKGKWVWRLPQDVFSELFRQWK
jgi:RecA-family ATPase